MSPRFSGFLAANFTLLSSFAYSPTLKMEATYSSGGSIDFHRTTRPYIPEDKIVHSTAVRISDPKEIWLLYSTVRFETIQWNTRIFICFVIFSYIA
jgi:hypothetical protein